MCRQRLSQANALDYQSHDVDMELLDEGLALAVVEHGS